MATITAWEVIGASVLAFNLGLIVGAVLLRRLR
jgi:hypothetical protein